MIYILITIMFLLIYILWRNFVVYKYVQWFNDKCFEYTIKEIYKGTYKKSINEDEIVGDYFYLLLSFRSIESMILDRKKYDKIIGDK